MPEDSKFYEVEKIIGKKKIDGKTNYLVKWKNYSESQATWQELSTLEYVKPLIKEFNDELKSRRKSNSRSNKSSECVTPQNSPSRNPQMLKKADRGKLYANNLRSLDEENVERMYKNLSLKHNNHHISNIFVNMEQKVQDIIRKQGQSQKIINVTITPKQFVKAQKFAHFDLDKTKDIDEDSKGKRKPSKLNLIKKPASKKFICEKRDDENNQPPKFAQSNVQSSSLVDSLISKNQEKEKVLQKQYSINHISCEKDLNDSLILSKQITLNKTFQKIQQIPEKHRNNESQIKSITSKQFFPKIKRINILHNLKKSQNRQYLIEQADSSIKILSGKELLKQHPHQLLEYFEFLISEKGI